ncbi:formyltetrahydrofolate deformylase, partial [Pseudomonas syringae pv. tagetis]
MSRSPDTCILSADCPSVLGTVDSVTRFLFEQGCYVTEHNSFDDRLSGRFFIRVEFRQPDAFDELAFRAGVSERGEAFGMI